MPTSPFLDFVFDFRSLPREREEVRRRRGRDWICGTLNLGKSQRGPPPHAMLTKTHLNFKCRTAIFDPSNCNSGFRLMDIGSSERPAPACRAIRHYSCCGQSDFWNCVLVSGVQNGQAMKDSRELMNPQNGCIIDGIEFHIFTLNIWTTIKRRVGQTRKKLTTAWEVFIYMLAPILCGFRRNLKGLLYMTLR